MGRGVAIVTHSVSTNDRYCEFNSPSDGFGERSVCQYYTIRHKTEKRGSWAKLLPRCTLFGEWLEREGVSTVRCTACKIACGEVENNGES
jgi:hypothetical protein